MADLHLPATEVPPEAALPLPPDDPATLAQWRRWAEAHVARERLLPPLSRDELLTHAGWLVRHHGLPPEHTPLVALFVSNAVWRDVVAAVPFDRRLLLLPLCLSDRAVCRGERDEVGLICAHCGACVLDRIVHEAQRLGMVTLIAEGATVVRMLLADGKIDAVIGVGCLDTLTRLFPDLSRHAIPGIGVPLLTTGCQDTRLEVESLLQLMREQAPESGARLPDLDTLERTVREWMTPEALTAALGAPAGQVERLGRHWLATGGKRWRPLLTVAVHAVLHGEAAVGETRLTALAVESLHKASLIHDDIEDGDTERYGQPTLHAFQGIPVAINVGDFLIGEGYRLLLGLPVEAATKIRMLQTAAEGHHALCQGQGEELAFAAQPAPLTLATFIRLCERKTGAAFEVAILLGAIQGGAGEETCAPLRRFSRALGVAYQIRDDLADAARPAGGDLEANRPSVLLALACESEDPRVATALQAFWRHDPDPAAAARGLACALRAAGQFERAEQLAAHHLHAAERALSELHHVGLKRLLRRMATRLLEPVVPPRS